MLAMLAISATGCPTEVEPGPAPLGPAPSRARGASEAGSPPAPTPATAPPAEAAAGPLGRVLPDAPLPLLRILGATPAEAEAHFGPPIAKGGTKKSCIRFVPDRVFFACQFTWQRYSDATGTFGALEVHYEDGRATSIAFEELPGEGALDPRGALAKVGLELPGEPQVDEPAPDVKRWSWFNSAARLLIGEQQYRVELSSVGGRWQSAKVEVTLNHPLTEAQRAKVVEVKPQAEGAGG